MKMMKPVGNENVGSDKKKWAVIGGIGTAVLALVVCLCVLVLRSEDDLTVQQDDYSQAAMLEWEGNNDAMVKTLASTTIVGDKVPLSDFPFDDEGNLKEEPDVVKNGGYVAVYTGIKTNQDDLVELLKWTIKNTHKMIDEEYEGLEEFTEQLQEIGDTASDDEGKIYVMKVLKPVIDVIRGNEDAFTEDIDDILDIHDDGLYPEYVNEWSYWDYMGLIGDWMMNDEVYDHFGDARPNSAKFNTMKRFVRYGGFDIDVDTIEVVRLSGISDSVMPCYQDGHQDIYYEINYSLEFRAKDPYGEGMKTYHALFGNRDMHYVLLDMIAEDDDMAPEIRNSNPIPDSLKETITGTDKQTLWDISDGKTGVDPSDPYYGCAGYQGPKEGYVFVPTIGYREESKNEQMKENLNKAATSEPNYFDFSGHLKAYSDLGLEGTGEDYSYEDWCANNMDYVNSILKEWGITFEKYMEYNHD